MNVTLLSHVLAYVFLLSVLIISLFSSRWHWISKLVLVICVPVACFFAYQTWREAQGWPSHTQLPERFMLNGAVVEEPDPELGNEGGIFLWLSDIGEHTLANEPRAYRLAYDQELHLDIQQALRKVRDGNLQIGERVSEVRTGQSLNPNRSVGGIRQDIIKFRKLPDPALPEK